MIPKTDGSFDYEYFIKDHLGNTRVTIQETAGQPKVMQENHYYPFGMALAGQTYADVSQTLKNDYLYNGKEFQDDLGLDWYDYGARFYDATIGRWHSIDPKAEKYFPISPYAYCADNPIKYFDPNGKEIWISMAYQSSGKTFTITMQYKNGELYLNKKKYGGKIASFVAFKNQLNQLKKDNSYSRDIVNQLEGSKNIHTITNVDVENQGKEKGNYNSRDKTSGNTTTVIYNPFSSEGPEKNDMTSQSCFNS